MPDAATAITQPPPTHPARSVPTLATRIAVVVDAVDRLLADITAANEPDSPAPAVEADPDMAVFDRLQLARAELLRAAGPKRRAGRRSLSEALARWCEAGAVMERRAPELFRAFLRAHEATVAELPVTTAGEMWP